MRTSNILTLLIVMLLVIACTETDYPDPIFDPDDPGAPSPTITTIDPPDLAYEGITVVTITGTNFSETLTQNLVTFNGRKATLDADASTPTSLVATVPLLIEDSEINAVDSVQVMVAVQGAFAGAVYDQNFRVERAVISMGGFVGEVPSKEPNAVAVDADENIYVAGGDGNLYKIDATGERTEFGAGLSSITMDLAIGPGGYVYFARNNPFVYRFEPTGGDADRWLRVDGKITCIDFNEQQDMYCAGASDSIFIVEMNTETPRGLVEYLDYDLAALRVFDGSLYVAGKYDGDDVVEVIEGIWKHAILDTEGNLGAGELVLDWSAYIGEGGESIRSLIVSSEGLWYLGMSGLNEDGTYSNGEAVLTFDPATGTLEPFYSAVLTAPGGHMKWGTGPYIYAARFIPDAEIVTGAPEAALMRIALDGMSAPYYGRD